MKKRVFISCFLLMVLVGCTTTQKGTSIGAVTGAGLGGIIGHQSGNAGAGAAIGGAVGALGGYVIGDKVGAKKFCPVGGEQYDASVMYCPTHGVELKDVQK